jgi:hypothetical protein
LISPDGTKVALGLRTAQDPPGLHVVDLRSGVTQTYNVEVSVLDGGALVWSPDSAWVIAAEANGKLDAYSASTNEGVSLGLGLPSITRVTVRVGTPFNG